MKDEQSYSQCKRRKRGPKTMRSTVRGVASLFGKAMQGGARAEITHPMETKTQGGLVLQEGLGFCLQGGRGGGENKNRVEGETRGWIISEAGRGKQKKTERGRSGKGGIERIKAEGRKEGRREKRGNGEAKQKREGGTKRKQKKGEGANMKEGRMKKQRRGEMKQEKGDGENKKQREAKTRGGVERNKEMEREQTTQNMHRLWVKMPSR